MFTVKQQYNNKNLIKSLPTQIFVVQLSVLYGKTEAFQECLLFLETDGTSIIICSVINLQEAHWFFILLLDFNNFVRSVL